MGLWAKRGVMGRGKDSQGQVGGIRGRWWTAGSGGAAGPSTFVTLWPAASWFSQTQTSVHATGSGVPIGAHPAASTTF